MTFQPTAFEREGASLAQPLQTGLKHRADYAAIVEKIGGDLVGAIACASIAANVLEANDDSWHREWFTAGEAGLKRAKYASKAGKHTTAQSDLRRASIYFSAAELYLPYDDPRRSRTVERLETSCRDYIRSLTPAGSVESIPATGEGFHEAYLVQNSDPTSPIVVCIGGWDELKENLIPLIEPALAWGLSVLLVEPPRAVATTGRGYDRFGVAAFLMACIDYLAESDGMSAHPVALYGVGAGATFASEVAQLDDRVRAIAGDFAGVRGLRNSAIFRSFIGSDRPAAARGDVLARDTVSEAGTTVIDTSPEMTVVDIFNEIAGRLAQDRG